MKHLPSAWQDYTCNLRGVFTETYKSSVFYPAKRFSAPSFSWKPLMNNHITPSVTFPDDLHVMQLMSRYDKRQRPRADRVSAGCAQPSPGIRVPSVGHQDIAPPHHLE